MGVTDVKKIKNPKIVHIKPEVTSSPKLNKDAKHTELSQINGESSKLKKNDIAKYVDNKSIVNSQASIVTDVKKIVRTNHEVTSPQLNNDIKRIKLSQLNGESS